jgi:hypothetical protein
MKKLITVGAGGLLVVAACLTLNLRPAAASSAASTDLQHDLQAAQAGPTGTANDTDSAAELDTDNGQVENVDEQEADSGDHQSGDATKDQSTEPQNDSNASSSDSGASGPEAQDGTTGQSSS